MAKLEVVLGSIGQDMQSSMIIPWLRDDFIPFVVKVLPQGQVQQKTNSLSKLSRLTVKN